MKNVNRKSKYYLLILSLFMISSGVFAYKNTSNYSINSISLDTVEISLDRYKEIGGYLQKYEEENISTLPGATVSFIPKITNMGAECWIRAKVGLNSTLKDNWFGYESLEGISTNWVYKDGYYYLMKPLGEYENVDFCKNVIVPSGLGKEIENSSYYLDIQVDAIQKKNFNPNFDKDNPWGTVEVEQTIRSRNDRR